MSKNLIIGFVILVSILSFSTIASAQTSAFVYQGKLQDGGVAANGTYQFEFKLFDAAAGGNQIGNTISNLPATVTGGIFAVNLDFGASNFDGTPRFLEIGVRLNGGNQPYTTLNPRQAVTSTPYAVRSLNANQATTANNSLNLGGVPANQYVVTTDPRMSDDRDPLPGSGNYIQNSANQQASSNFNISGEGKADKFTAATQFNIGANRILSNPGTDNLFAGVNAGINNAAGGTNNSFFGANAGKTNTTGNANAFFGRNAGFANTNGSNNAFFGTAAGQTNADGSSNVFFGGTAGLLNTTGSFNVFVGRNSGVFNTTGSDNTFVGNNAGNLVTNGTGNVFIGSNAGSTGNVFNSIAIGANVKVAASYTAQIGTNLTTVKLPGSVEIGSSLSVGTAFSAGGSGNFGGDLDVGGSMDVTGGIGVDGYFNGKNGQFSQLSVTQLLTSGAVMNGVTHITTIKYGSNNGAGGDSDFICKGEDDNVLRPCFAGFNSNAKNVENFAGGLKVIKNLRAVTFNSNVDDKPDLGLIFADASAVQPLFSSRSADGSVEGGVRYRQIIPALVGAAQEQQAQIERQQEQIRQQQAQIDALKALVCQSNPNAAVCRK
ncbi:MAG TPA: hypothetical protein VF604_09800 [Pyrinomonadaceae bacterium]